MKYKKLHIFNYTNRLLFNIYTFQFFIKKLYLMTIFYKKIISYDNF